jgi:FMN phosphatase YigB (HAD superfamily)
VLERVGPPLWTETWRARLGLSRSQFDAAVSGVDREGMAETGGFSEAEMRESYGKALRLSPPEVDELMAAVWNWYCGELDEQLVTYVRRLRPRVRTGIVSNSADGARREETRRYAFPELVDDIVYSHEVGLAKPSPAIYALACERLAIKPSEAALVDDVPANVDGAARIGLHAVLHESTAATIRPSARSSALSRGRRRPDIWDGCTVSGPRVRRGQKVTAATRSIAAPSQRCS